MGWFHGTESIAHNAGEINARRSPEPANRLNHGQGRKGGKDGAQAPATRLVLHRRSINLRPTVLFPAPHRLPAQGLPVLLCFANLRLAGQPGIH